MKTINATEFKAKCLSILDEVSTSGELVTILKRGKPVARLVPPAPVGGRYPQEALKGTVTVVGDVVAPAVPADEWNAVQGKLEPGD